MSAGRGAAGRRPGSHAAGSWAVGQLQEAPFKVPIETDPNVVLAAWIEASGAALKTGVYSEVPQKANLQDSNLLNQAAQVTTMALSLCDLALHPAMLQASHLKRGGEDRHKLEQHNFEHLYGCGHQQRRKLHTTPI